jgi:succinate-semialdehyde dehydrogenase / glutarate-semialdehyde dehydrogenase
MKLTDNSLLRMQAYIGGKWEHADGGGTRDVVNPATGEKLGTIPDMGAAETRRAIEAAKAAFPPGPARRRRNAPSSCAAGSS